MFTTVYYETRNIYNVLHQLSVRAFFFFFFLIFPKKQPRKRVYEIITVNNKPMETIIISSNGERSEASLRRTNNDNNPSVMAGGRRFRRFARAREREVKRAHRGKSRNANIFCFKFSPYRRTFKSIEIYIMLFRQSQHVLIVLSFAVPREQLSRPFVRVRVI